MSKIRFYTESETKKIIRLFETDNTPREVIEQYAKSIGRTYLELKHKWKYEISRKGSSNIWKEGEIAVLVKNWENWSPEIRNKYADSVSRTYGACQKAYYKNRNKVAIKTAIDKIAEVRSIEALKITKATEAVSRLSKKRRKNKFKVISVHIGAARVHFPLHLSKIYVGGIEIAWE